MNEKHRLLTTQIDFLEEDKNFLKVLKKIISDGKAGAMKRSQITNS